MKRAAPSPACPCGLPASYEECCGRYIDHPECAAPTAEALMRSRYTAYTRQDAGYLQASWYPDTRPDQLELSDPSAPVKWLGLEILNRAAGQAGDQDGVVEFVARYKVNGRAYRLHEISQFVCQAGRWYYKDGEMTD